MILNNVIRKQIGRLLRVGLAATLAVLMFTLIGCAGQTNNKTQSQDQSDKTSTQETTETEVQTKQTIPNTYFTSYGSNETRSALVDLEGSTIQFENPDMVAMGGFSNGYVFVSWTTSDYDEEWKRTINKVTHYGLVDDTGKLAIDLTDLVHSYDWTEKSIDQLRTAEVINSPTYVDGRLVLCLDWSSSYVALLVLDENGNLKFTVGDKDAFQYAAEDMSGKSWNINLTMTPSNFNYCDGILALAGVGQEGSLVLDTEGSVLYRETGSSGSLNEYLGKGYVIPYNNGTPNKVVDYSGNTLFDLSSVNIEGDIGNARFAPDQPTSDGVVYIRAEKLNPYGGENKKLEGLYSISTGKWLVPLFEGHVSFEVYNGCVYVSVADKSILTEGYGATDSDKDNDYSCILDLSGSVLVDYQTSSFAEANIPTEFLAYYFGNGYWELTKAHGTSQFESIMTCIEQGAVKGYTAAPNKLETSLYPFTF